MKILMKLFNYLVRLKKNEFIYIVLTIFVIMWGGDGIVKDLGCAIKCMASNLILDMSWSWHHDDDLLWIQQTINIEHPKRNMMIMICHGFDELLIVSLIFVFKIFFALKLWVNYWSSTITF